jgi:hypothetical protein
VKFRSNERITPKRSPDERRTARKAVVHVCHEFEQMGFRAIPHEGAIHVDRAVHVVADAAFAFPAGPTLTAAYAAARKEATGGKVPVGVVVTRIGPVGGHTTRALAVLDLRDLLEFLHAWDERSTQVAARARRFRANGTRQETPESSSELPSESRTPVHRGDGSTSLEERC